MTKFAMCGKVMAEQGQRNALVEVLLEAAEMLGDMPECELAEQVRLTPVGGKGIAT